MKNQPLKIFEQTKKTDDHGNEFWTARDLVKILEYSEYRHFLPVITKAKESCENSKRKVSDHFEEFLEMIELANGARREIDNIKLSRYACDPTFYAASLSSIIFTLPPPQKNLGEKCPKIYQSLKISKKSGRKFLRILQTK